MGKKNDNKVNSTATPELQNITLREENIGRTHISVFSKYKLDHLHKLAVWASGESSVPSLAALFGQRLAASAESIGVPVEHSLFLCQRCETVIQPGDNCTVRIESNHDKLKRRKSQRPQNNVVYTCHFCSHRNIIRGTTKDCAKELSRSRVKRYLDVKESSKEVIDFETHIHADSKENPVDPFTPSSLLSGKTTKSLGAKSCKADSSRKICVSSDASEATGKSSKRKRRQWASLKDIVENNENANQAGMSTLVIPLEL